MTHPLAGSWTTASLDASLRRALLGGAAAWQVVMLGAVIASHPRLPMAGLIVVHLMAAGLALLALRRARLAGPLVIVLLALLFVDCRAAPSTNGPLCLAACWLGDLTFLIPGLLWRGRTAYAVPVVGAACVGVGLVILAPGWPATLSVSFVVTATAMVVASRLGLPVLRRLAESADQEAALAEEERQAAVVAERAGREAAEDARVLHDTVINTLGAIANGGGALRDEAAVRERCGRDVATVSELLAGRGVAVGTSLADVASRPVGIPVRRTGLADADLLRHEALLPTEASHALVAATGELVLNAVKHSGAAEVVIDVRRDDAGLRVTVSDDGVGFSGVAIEGRGLAESVVARMEAVGGQVRLRSARGAGTRVELTYAAGRGAAAETAATPVDEAEVDVLVAGIRRRACWVWAAGTVGVGLVIEAANRPGQLTATYAMLALVAVVTLLARVTCRSGRTLPGWLLPLAVGAVPAAFLLDLASIGFGTVAVPTYQAIGFVPLFVQLLVLARQRWPLWLATGLFGVAVVVAAAAVADRGPGAVGLVLVAAAPAVGLLVAWVGFSGLVGRLVTSSEASRREAFHARVEVAARRAVVGARARWRRAGLRSAQEILQGLAEGRLDARTPEIQAACAEEEAYLRQLILLSPEAFRISGWLAQALAEARTGSVRLAVRSGEVDAPDELAARALGELVLEAVRTAPVESDLVVGLFQTLQGPRLTLVGSSARLLTQAKAWSRQHGWGVEARTLGGQNLVEIGW